MDITAALPMAALTAKEEFARHRHELGISIVQIAAIIPILALSLLEIVARASGLIC